MTDIEPLLTRKEVAKLLQVSPRTVIRLEKQGKIPRVQLSGIGVRYKPSTIRAFIDGKEIFSNNIER